MIRAQGWWPETPLVILPEQLKKHFCKVSTLVLCNTQHFLLALTCFSLTLNDHASNQSSAETSSLQQREACRHGLQLVTGGPQQCGIIPVDAPENGQLCFCLGCVVLQVAAPFTTWAPFKEWLVFSGMTVVSELCYHGADWRTGIHFLHANKMHKQTTDVWGVGEHLGCLICESSLLYRPK